jgi:peptidoglycan/LPS O-acetylase OafA/YrhL
MTDGGKALRYRPDIDGIRALAILPVLAFHAFPHRVPGGFIGVDIFFVVSGYLISSIIFYGLQNGDFSFTSFYAFRIRRIFPPLACVLIFSLAFGWFVLLPDEYEQLGRHIAASAAFLQNFNLLQEAGYFDIATEASMRENAGDN